MDLSLYKCYNFVKEHAVCAPTIFTPFWACLRRCGEPNKIA